MVAQLGDEVKALLDAPNFWHLSTLNLTALGIRR
jgi:hypothetical protein